jgi:hypothetical protein
VQLTADFSVTHNLLIYTDHVNLLADMRNLKARNCEDVLDSSSNGPLAMEACRCEVTDTVTVESRKKSKYKDK